MSRKNDDRSESRAVLPMSSPVERLAADRKQVNAWGQNYSAPRDADIQVTDGVLRVDGATIAERPANRP